MKYTKDSSHKHILGKAGDFVDVLSRVPADTEIVIDIKNIFSDWRNHPEAINISLRNYEPIRHIISLMDDGSLKSTLTVGVCFCWNRDKNLPEAETFAAMFRVLEFLFRTNNYDLRRMPRPDNIAKTAANNPSAFLDMLNEFQKKYRGKMESKEKKK